MPTNSPVYDTVILGGGIVGAATAYELARRGKRILLIDQFEPGHRRGSSHGDSRMIRFAYPEPIYLEMAKLAYPAWAELSERIGEPLLHTTGSWDCGPAGCLQLAELEANLQRFDIFYERPTAAESNKRFPMIYLDAGSEVIYQPDGAIVFATRAVQALWDLAIAAGATVMVGERVREITLHQERIRLHSAADTWWTATRLVVAAGGWSQKLMAKLNLDLSLEITQEQLAYYPAKDEIDHRVGVMPNIIDYHTPQPFYALPQVDVPGVKAGWHHTGPMIDPDHPQPLDEANLAAVQAWLRDRLPHLDPTPIDPQPCLYTNTLDYHFVIDRHPDLPQIIMGTGFSGHGFKFGPVLGQILTSLVLDETPPVPLTQFSLSRFAQPEKLERRTNA